MRWDSQILFEGEAHGLEFLGAERTWIPVYRTIYQGSYLWGAVEDPITGEWIPATGDINHLRTQKRTGQAAYLAHRGSESKPTEPEERLKVAIDMTARHLMEEMS
jgi:hypothetical protein